MANEELLKKAVEAFDALSPEQKATMLEEQRQSWVRGNVGLSRDERGITTPVMPRPAAPVAGLVQSIIDFLEADEDNIYHLDQKEIDTLRKFLQPAAPVEGLETVAWRHPTLQWVSEHYKSVERHCFNRDPKPEPLVTRSQAEELLAAERAENDEAYELGKRDGYSEAVQEIDLKTGGDGEYRYCTDHDPERHTPDPETMIQRIVDRFETLNTMESISEIHEWKERAEKAKADNAAKDADNEALTARVNGFEGFLDDLAEILGCERDIGDVVNELDAINNRAEALETQLAAARKALEATHEAISEYYRYQYGGEMRGSYDGKPERDGLWKAMYKARAALEDRP